MSWKSFGGKNVYDKTQSIRAKNIVAETFTFGGVFNGTIQLSVGDFITPGDISAGTNSTLNHVLVRDRIRFEDISDGVFLTGDFSHVGINVETPEAILDICGNMKTILQVHSSQEDTRNVMTKNVDNHGMIMSSDSSAAALHFYHGSFDVDSVDSSSGAVIQYTNTDVFQLETQDILHLKSDVVALSSNATLDLSNSDATVLIQDKYVADKNKPSSFYLPHTFTTKDDNAYRDGDTDTFTGNDGVTTGVGLHLMSRDKSSNVFMSMTNTDNVGWHVGGGKWDGHAMGTMGWLDTCGSHYYPNVQRYIPSQTSLSSNRLERNRASTGFNTFIPTVDRYVVDINGPLHIEHNEVHQMARLPFQASSVAFSRDGQFGMIVSVPTDIEDDNKVFKVSIAVTDDRGKTWTVRENALDSPNDTGNYLKNGNLIIHASVLDGSYGVVSTYQKVFLQNMNSSIRDVSFNKGKVAYSSRNITDIALTNSAELHLVSTGENTNANFDVAFISDISPIGSSSDNDNDNDDVSFSIDSANLLQSVTKFEVSTIDKHNNVALVTADVSKHFFYHMSGGTIDVSLSLVSEDVDVSMIAFKSVKTVGNLIVAVGAPQDSSSNNILYSYDYGSSDMSFHLFSIGSGVVLNDVVLIDTSNALFVGNAGMMIYTRSGLSQESSAFTTVQTSDMSSMGNSHLLLDNSVNIISVVPSGENGDRNSFVFVCHREDNVWDISDSSTTLGTEFVKEVTNFGITNVYTAYLPWLFYPRESESVLHIVGNTDVCGTLYVHNQLRVDGLIDADVEASKLTIDGDTDFSNTVQFLEHVHVRTDISFHDVVEFVNGGQVNVVADSSFFSHVEFVSGGHVDVNADISFYNKIEVNNETTYNSDVLLAPDVEIKSKPKNDQSKTLVKYVEKDGLFVFPSHIEIASCRVGNLTADVTSTSNAVVKGTTTKEFVVHELNTSEKVTYNPKQYRNGTGLVFRGNRPNSIFDYPGISISFELGTGTGQLDYTTIQDSNLANGFFKISEHAYMSSDSFETLKNDYEDQIDNSNVFYADLYPYPEDSFSFQAPGSQNQVRMNLGVSGLQFTSSDRRNGREAMMILRDVSGSGLVEGGDEYEIAASNIVWSTLGLRHVDICGTFAVDELATFRHHIDVSKNVRFQNHMQFTSPSVSTDFSMVDWDNSAIRISDYFRDLSSAVKGGEDAFDMSYEDYTLSVMVDGSGNQSNAIITMTGGHEHSSIQAYGIRTDASGVRNLLLNPLGGTVVLGALYPSRTDNPTLDVCGSVQITNVGTGAASDLNTSHALSVSGGLAVEHRVDVSGFVRVDGCMNITKDLTISGNLTVYGTTTSIDTSNLVIEDRIITLARNVSGSSDRRTNDVGLLINRGTDVSSQFIGWNESADVFTMGETSHDGTTTGSVNVTIGTVHVNVSSDTIKSGELDVWKNVRFQNHMQFTSPSVSADFSMVDWDNSAIRISDYFRDLSSAVKGGEDAFDMSYEDYTLSVMVDGSGNQSNAIITMTGGHEHSSIQAYGIRTDASGVRNLLLNPLGGTVVLGALYPSRTDNPTLDVCGSVQITNVGTGAASDLNTSHALSVSGGLAVEHRVDVSGFVNVDGCMNIIDDLTVLKNVTFGNDDMTRLNLTKGTVHIDFSANPGYDTSSVYSMSGDVAGLVIREKSRQNCKVSLGSGVFSGTIILRSSTKDSKEYSSLVFPNNNTGYPKFGVLLYHNEVQAGSDRNKTEAGIDVSYTDLAGMANSGVFAMMTSGASGEDYRDHIVIRPASHLVLDTGLTTDAHDNSGGNVYVLPNGGGTMIVRSNINVSGALDVSTAGNVDFYIDKDIGSAASAASAGSAHKSFVIKEKSRTHVDATSATLVLEHDNSGGGGGVSNILFPSKIEPTDYGMIGFQDDASYNYGISMNYTAIEKNDNSNNGVLFMVCGNDTIGSSQDSILIRPSGNMVLDTGTDIGGHTGEIHIKPAGGGKVVIGDCSVNISGDLNVALGKRIGFHGTNYNSYIWKDSGTLKYVSGHVNGHSFDQKVAVSGGIDVTGGGAVDFSGSTVTVNKLVVDGSGIDVTGGNVDFSGSTVTVNKLVVDGSGIDVTGGNVDFSGSTVTTGALTVKGTFDVSTNNKVDVYINKAITSAHKSFVIKEKSRTHVSATSATLVLEHDNSGGVSSILFPSRQNYGSDWAMIGYQDDASNKHGGFDFSYSEIEAATSENSVLFLITQNDGPGVNPDSIVIRPCAHLVLDTGSDTGIHTGNIYMKPNGGDSVGKVIIGCGLTVSSTDAVNFSGSTVTANKLVVDGSGIDVTGGITVSTDGITVSSGAVDFSNSSVTTGNLTVKNSASSAVQIDNSMNIGGNLSVTGTITLSSISLSDDVFVANTKKIGVNGDGDDYYIHKESDTMKYIANNTAGHYFDKKVQINGNLDLDGNLDVSTNNKVDVYINKAITSAHKSFVIKEKSRTHVSPTSATLVLEHDNSFGISNILFPSSRLGSKLGGGTGYDFGMIGFQEDAGNNYGFDFSYAEIEVPVTGDEYTELKNQNGVMFMVTGKDEGNTWRKDSIVIRPSGNLILDTGSSVGNIYMKPRGGGKVEIGCGVIASSFNANSDYRLKDAVQNMSTDQSLVVDMLRPVTYVMKSSAKRHMGFLAHEVQEYFPGIVNGEKDGSEMQSINYIELIPLLVKEVQDLKTTTRSQAEEISGLKTTTRSQAEEISGLKTTTRSQAEEISGLKTRLAQMENEFTRLFQTIQGLRTVGM